MIKTLLVAGARPNYMKIAPLIHEMTRECRGFDWKLVDTGQHYDYPLSRVFLEEFDLSRPHHFLGVGSATHGEQTARIMTRFEQVCIEENPCLVIVVGDVNSTLACSLTARKMGIAVAHVEAGLRSFDRSMPEEINRQLTDSLSDFLFVSERSGLLNLEREGFCLDREGDASVKGSRGKVFFSGNVMIDTLRYCLEKLQAPGREKNSGEKRPYAVLTLHRPANVDTKEKLCEILAAVGEIAADGEVVFPAHPRTRKNLETFGLIEWVEGMGISLRPPLSYLPFLALWKDAALVLTDSGGIQEETTALGIPCFTIRENTERPITVEDGTNVLVGTRGDGIRAAYSRFRRGELKAGRVPELWDGRSAERIVEALAREMASMPEKVLHV